MLILAFPESDSAESTALAVLRSTAASAAECAICGFDATVTDSVALAATSSFGGWVLTSFDIVVAGMIATTRTTLLPS